MAHSSRGEARTREGANRHESPRRVLPVARAGLLVVGAFVFTSLFLARLPSQAERTDAPDKDFPELFQSVAIVLKHAYLDLDRADPRLLMQKAFASLENAVDEVYVESSEATKPYVALHLEGKVQVFNLDAVDSLDSAVKMLENTFVFIKRNYRGDQELNEIRYATINGFLSGLDPHTMVFSPKAFREFKTHIQGDIFGVGMYVGSRDGKLLVIEVLKNTPALRAGFKKGDVIAKIGDESTINMTVPEAVEKIRGPRGSWITLTVKRAKADKPDELETLDIRVQRDRVVIKSVESKLIKNWNQEAAGPWKGGVGYVKVVNFDENTTPSLREHLQRMRQENGGKPFGSLIIDLRDNSGGLLTQAIDMSDLFLKSGTIVMQAARGDRVYSQEAKNDGDEPDCPIIVLANKSSASGAEIVIGALQKNNRAIVLGTPTFGKGSVQQLHRLPNGAQLKLTVSEYLLPGKISIQENGVVPDIYAKAAVLKENAFDLFANERMMTEKDYEQHIVSRFAKKEVPSYTFDYYFDKPEEDIYSNAFISGDLTPEKEKIVQMALRLLKLSNKPFDPRKVLDGRRKDVLAYKAELFDEIVSKLAEMGINWGFNGGTPKVVDRASVDLSLSSEIIEEPSGDADDLVPVKKVLVKARLTNKGKAPLYRMKGLSRSAYFLYKDQEFLFGKVKPSETVERSVKISIPYFPRSRSDLFTLEVSSMPATPGWDQEGDVILSRSTSIELKDAGRPAFAYRAELFDASDPKHLKQVRALRPDMEAVLRLQVRNTGSAPVYKGIAILRNESGPTVFLQKGRIEFPRSDAGSGKTIVPGGDGSPGTRKDKDSGKDKDPGKSKSSGKEPSTARPLPSLKPGETQNVEFSFQLRDEKLDTYSFELAIVDAYSSANLVRKLSIAAVSKEEAPPFPSGEEFAPPRVEQLLARAPSSRDAARPVLVTKSERICLDAKIQSPDGDGFKAWIFNSLVGKRGLPDKVYFTDSKGESSIDISTCIPLRKGMNYFTVVAKDRNDLETQDVLFVRRD